MTVIQTGLAYIPANCRLRADVDEILALYAAGADADAAMAHIHSRYDEFSAHGWCMTNPNTMIVVMALLWGGRDFGKTLCLAVQPGFDTDCNGATAGSILGMLNAAVPAEWLAPFAGNVITSIEGFHHVHTSDMAARTLALCRLPEEPETEPVEETAPAEEPVLAEELAPMEELTPVEEPLFVTGPVSAMENPLFDEEPTPAAPARPRGNFCPECGTPVEEYYIFCSECGKRL